MPSGHRADVRGFTPTTGRGTTPGARSLGARSRCRARGQGHPFLTTLRERRDLRGESVLATLQEAGGVDLAVRRRVLREPPIQGRPVVVARLDGLLPAADRSPPDPVERGLGPG